MITVKLKPLLINIAIPLLLIGGLSALFTMSSMNLYETINTPPLSPPGWIFPIVWSILFILMGIASYIIWESKSPNSKTAFIVYAAQLIVNFMWSIVFFNIRAYSFAVVVIIALIILICLNIFYFSKIKGSAGLLLIPYLLWVAFATYLNIAIAILN